MAHVLRIFKIISERLWKVSIFGIFFKFRLCVCEVVRIHGLLYIFSPIVSILLEIQAAYRSYS